MGAVGSSQAQMPSKLEHYSTEDGLSHDIITCMFKDRDGFMWFGTWDGINRFDGKHFVAYKSAPGDSSQIKNDRIDQITEDTQRNLWVKCYDGQVYKFNKASRQFKPLSHILGLKEKPVFDRILFNDQGALWVSTLNQGIIAIPDLINHPQIYQWFKKGGVKGQKLPDNQISFFYKDHQSVIWVGTPQGLVSIRKSSSGKFLSSYIPLPANSSKQLISVCEKAGRLYFGTGGGDVLTYDPYTGVITQLCKPSSGKINALASGKNGEQIYAVTSLGELIFINSVSGVFTRQINPQHDELLSILEDKYGDLWLQPAHRGVVYFEVQKKQFRTFVQKNDAVKKIPISHFRIFTDNAGIVWCVLRDGGFGYYDHKAGDFRYFYNEPGSRDRLFSNLVTVAFYDPAGIMWLHTDHRGIEKIIIPPNQFKQQLLVNPGTFKSDNEVRGLLSDHRGRLWVGVKSNKIYLFDHGREIKQPFINMPAEGMSTAHSFFEDARGLLYIGTKSDGLFTAQPIDSTYTQYRLTQYKNIPGETGSLSSNQIYTILGDKYGRVWIGAYDHGLNMGVWKNNRLTFTRCMLPVNNPNDFQRIRHMTMDNQNRLWLGTTDGLVICNVAPNHNISYKMFTKSPGDGHSLGNNDIQYILKDSRQRMWLATSGGGLNLVHQNGRDGKLKFEVLSMKHGLASDYILSCTEDLKHRIWVATKSSISRIDPETREIRNFNSYDGVPTLGFSEASCQRQPGGHLVFGTINGLLNFNPDSVGEHPIKANLVLTNLQINNKDVQSGDKDHILTDEIGRVNHIILPYNQNTISLDYAMLDYRFDDRPMFLYKLAGFDKEWQNNKFQRRATYTNLSPGSYVFEVKCEDNALYTNIPATRLAITIRPPFWKTWWAYLIYIAIVILVLETVRRIAFTMLRLRHKVALEKKLADLKLNFFTNVSHELRTPLTLIVNPVEHLLTQNDLPAEYQENLSIVQRNANRLERFVNQLLDLRKVQSGKASLNLSRVELVSFVKEIGECFKGIGSSRSVAFCLDSDVSSLIVKLDPDKMETVIYNLLSNAFKFAPVGTTVTVGVNTSGTLGEFSLSVTDQGCGVPDDDLVNIFNLYHESHHPDTRTLKGTGIGLALVKDFVELHGGSVCARNNENGGLKIIMNIPLVTDAESEDATCTPVGYCADNLFLDMPYDETVGDETSFYLTDDRDAPLLLLVEDNDDMRHFLQAQLQSHYRVEVAENGKAGLEKAQKILPDLILSDVMMPKLDGIQMLDRLKHDELTSHIPVILLSAKSAIESQVAGLTYGADYYITKPFNNAFLLAAVNNILNQRKNIVQKLSSNRVVVDLSPDQVMVTSKDQLFLEKVIGVVEEKMADPDFVIETVADEVNMARPTFFKKFKSLTQMAPVEFVRDMRLKRAKQYLDAGAGNITEVSYQVGFSSSKYFSTCFKAKYNMTPSEYLKQKAVNVEES